MAARLVGDELWRRPARIKELLRPLVTAGADVEVRPLTSISDYVLGAVPRGYSAGSIADASALRVPTAWEGIFFNYHEVWVYDGIRFYDLNRSYLHLYLATGPTRELQSLSLHCDPALATTEPAYVYKRGPHLHVGGAQPNIDRAHISLCVGDAQLGGNNVPALTNKLSKSIAMIADEIIPRYL